MTLLANRISKAISGSSQAARGREAAAGTWRSAGSASRRPGALASGVALCGALLLIITGTVAVTVPGGSRADPAVLSLHSPRVVVLKQKRLLHLFDGDRLVRSYPINLGADPVGPKRRQGDRRTPVGRFRVVTKNAQSPYHRFLGLDYPDAGAVERGLRTGLISPGEAASIRRALAAGRCPDWGTALGGGIGIHGRRIGRDWTAGCVALTDEHVEELFSVLRIGDPVEILP